MGIHQGPFFIHEGHDVHVLRGPFDKLQGNQRRSAAYDQPMRPRIFHLQPGVKKGQGLIKLRGVEIYHKLFFRSY